MVTRDPDPPKLRVTHLRRPTNEGKGSDLHAVGDDLCPWHLFIATNRNPRRDYGNSRWRAITGS